MGIEDQILGRIDKLAQKQESISADKERVKTLHANILRKIERERPNPDDFDDVVHAQEIKEETALVRSLEEKWGREDDPDKAHAKKLADIAEFAIHSAIGNWADAKINSLLASKPDDYLRKVDLIIEIPKEDESSFLPIGIDVVVVGKYSMAGLDAKLDFLKKEIQAGRECSVKYVESEAFKGSVSAPRAVIAVSAEHLGDYIRILEKNDLDKLHDHVTKYIIAYQLQNQYRQLYRIANALGHEHLADDYVQANNAAYDVFKSLFAEMQKDLKLNAKVADDPGVKRIDGFMDLFLDEVELS